MHPLLPRVALVAASLLALPALAETSIRSATGFTKVELQVPLDATIRSGKNFSVVLALADSDTGSRISTEVRGDTLVVSSTGHSLRMHGKNTITITMPELTSLSISGSGDAQVEGFDRGGSLALAISGSGNIHYSGKTKALAVAVAGSGDVKLVGNTGTLTVTIEGSGDFKGSDFSATNASVEVDGSGNADLQVAGGALQLAVNGSGDIRWSGQASAVSAVTHGSGSIQKKH